MFARRVVLRSQTHQSLQGTNEQLLKGLSGLVAVANVLERLGGILAGDVEKDLLTAAIRSQC